MASVVPDPPTRQLLRHDYCFGPNVFWSRGWETRGATGRLQIKQSGSGDENGLPQTALPLSSI